MLISIILNLRVCVIMVLKGKHVIFVLYHYNKKENSEFD